METISLNIDGKDVSVPGGSTLLDAAQQLGLDLPTMCYMEGPDHFPSCLICLVQNEQTGKLVPACSTLAAADMRIATDSEEVREARKMNLELLLSDHVGECEAPCQTNCPAHMDIPLMNRLLAGGRFDEALRVVKNDIALPAVLGRICPAPCERACRRRPMDKAVSICLLKRYAADLDLEASSAYLPEKKQATGKSVAIIGTGPAGLAAAYYLSILGYQCALFDRNPLPGGALRYAIPEEKLPREVLDREVDVIRALGAQFHMEQHIRADSIDVLRNRHDAVIVATGESDASFSGLEKRGTAFVAERNTHRTNVDGVFAIGSAIKPGRVAIRACAHGKEAAIAADQYLRGVTVVGEKKIFNSRFGKLLENEYTQYLLEADPGPRRETEGARGFTLEEVRQEAARCMHCDCRKVHDCRLRTYSDQYNASQSRFFPRERKPMRKIFKNKPVVYEPEKCIKCGICVRITSRHQERLGLTFIGKGFDVEVGVPFDRDNINALEKTAKLCAEQCPTGALAMRVEEA